MRCLIFHFATVTSQTLISIQSGIKILETENIIAAGSLDKREFNFGTVKPLISIQSGMEILETEEVLVAGSLDKREPYLTMVTLRCPSDLQENQNHDPKC